MTEKQQPNLAADFNLLAAAVIWGLNVVVMKFAISLLNPFWFNAFRFVFSVLALAIWIAIKRKRSSLNGRRGLISSEPDISRMRYVGTIVVYAVLFGIIYQVAFLMGIFNTSASSAALIMASTPMWTAAIAIIFLGERLSPVSWAGLAITLAGTIIVALDKPGADAAGASTLLGNAIMLFCALSWAASTVISRPVLKYISPVELTFWGMGLALPFHILIAIFFQPDADIQIAWQPKVASAILYSGIFSTGIALAMWSYGVKILGASHASIYGNLIPLVAMFFGWSMLNEVPTTLQFLGGAMIVCGLLAMRRG